MAAPRSVVKIKKDGVEFVSNVDRANYTIKELSRAALGDTARLVRKRMMEKLKQLPGMKKNRRVGKSAQYWVRRRETDLQIGFKHDTWYGARSELGTHGSPARNILRETVMENIDEIRKIQGQYLSAIEDAIKAQSKVSEGEYKSPEGEE